MCLFSFRKNSTIRLTQFNTVCRNVPLQHRFSKLLKTFEPCIATCHGLCAVIYLTGKALATQQFNVACSRLPNNVLHSPSYSHCNCAVQQLIHYKKPGTANQVLCWHWHGCTNIDKVRLQKWVRLTRNMS